MKQTAPTNCRLCGYLCALTAHIEDGRIVDVTPDENRFPYDPSLQKGCLRWRSYVDILNHPQRVNYPLKRVGERGSGQWQQIPWAQAVDEIAARLAKLKEQYGAETLATSIGGPHATYWPMHRFLNLFGTPNNVGIGQICWNPAIWINTLTFGWPVDNELDPDLTECAIVWGTNPAESDNSYMWRSIRRMGQAGKNLIVVDPRHSRTARVAKYWLPIRPATDSALALGLVHVVVNEKLYNAEFVARWCTGFDELKQHIARYTPQLCAEITGVPAERIAEVARLFAAGKPSTITHGRGIDQIGANSIATHRAIAILKALTGNVDVQGANHMGDMPEYVAEVDFELAGRLTPEQRAKGLGMQRTLLQSYAGYDRVRQETLKLGKRLPERYLTSAHPNLVWRAMRDSEPYPIRAMVVMGCNPLMTQADTKLIYEALHKLDLLVVLEYFKSSTALLADYIMPAASGLERALIQTNAGVTNLAYGGPKAIPPMFERHSDFDFWRGLGLRLGQSAEWPWETFEQALDAMFAPLGGDWQTFCQGGIFAGDYIYQKYQLADASGQPQGFATPSGKVELHSALLAELGYEPLPKYKTPQPYDVVKYPLQLITGARFQPYYASSYRQIARFRQMHPIPTAELSAATAQKFGIVDGHEIWVENDRGRQRFTAKICEICDGVVSIEYGWWYPDPNDDRKSLDSIWTANANVLTHADFESCEPLLGQWTYNGIPCRISRVATNESGLDTCVDSEEVFLEADGRVNGVNKNER